jgi:hypothetical protein
MEKKIKIEEKTTIKWTYENMVKFWPFKSL